MSNPSPEQQRIIDDASRIRIVRAAPGSGKTWLVGQIIKKELETWNKPGGIAALSFTRVGGEEIRNAVNYELDSPHFVGTLDSFLFKYIVKPFWNKIHPNYAPPRLIPAESGIEKWTKPPQKEIRLEISNKTTKKPYNLLKINYNGFDSFYNPILTYPKSFSGEFEIMPPDMANWAKSEKNKIIQNLGWMTHADVAFCAYQIVCNHQYGKKISELIANKFSFFIIDELQDTGFFAGQTILQFLKQSTNIRALLVGDPNQAIYEFNGATPSLFNNFKEIGVEIPLEQSRRCPSNITAIANSVIPNSINPNGEHPGNNTLIIYSDFERDIPNLMRTLNKQYNRIKFITRLNKNVYKLRKDKNKDPSKLGCHALTHMSFAVQAFYRGNNTKALGLAESCISLWLFQYEGITTEELKSKNIQDKNWNELVISCLLDCAKIDDSLSYEQWQTEAGIKIEEQIRQHSFDSFIKSKSLKPQTCKDSTKRKKQDRDVQMSIFFPSIRNTLNDVSLQTIHSVKGETHEATVFVIPPIATGKSRCPSELWWSSAPEDQEEKRIAYVAMTRSNKDFYLVVTEKTANNLKELHGNFYNYFEVKTIKEHQIEPRVTDFV